MDRKQFGIYFSGLREKSGYRSQRELAEKSGVSHSTINRIESGTHKVQPENLKILSRFLIDVTYEDLLKASGYMDKDEDDEKDFPSDVNVAYLDGVKHELDPEVVRRLKDDIKLFKQLKKQQNK